MAVTSDGYLLATGLQVPQGLGSAGAVQLWDALTGALKRTLTGPPEMVQAVALSPSSYLVAGQTTGGTYVWDSQTGRMQWKMQSTQPRLLAFSDDSRSLLVGTPGGMLRFYDAWSGRELRTMNLGSNKDVAQSDNERFPYLRDETSDHAAVSAYAILPDGNIATVEERFNTRRWAISLYVWDGQSGKQLQTFALQSLDFTSPEGKQIMRMMQNSFIFSFLQDLKLSPDGHTLAVAFLGKCRLWDTGTFHPLRTLNPQGLKDPDFNALVFTPDGRHIITTTGTVWDVQTGLRVRALTQSPINLAGHPQFVFYDTGSGSSPSPRIAASDFEKRTVQICEIVNGRLLLTLHALGVTKTKFGTTSRWISYTPDGHYIGSPGIESLIRWNVNGVLAPKGKFDSQFRSPKLVQQAASQN